tara:strand:- start:854 stop:1285 length:432 start_codon:yes stop_codon:yes gene_type:complete
MKPEIALGSDHGGFELKEHLKEYLENSDYTIKDFGCHEPKPVDYPDIAKKVGQYVAKNKVLGILICGAGIGMSMAANKIKGIRAALCYDNYTAKMSREHNNANILCLGGRTTDKDTAKEIVKTWLSTEFSNEERHIKRINKIE